MINLQQKLRGSRQRRFYNLILLNMRKLFSSIYFILFHLTVISGNNTGEIYPIWTSVPFLNYSPDARGLALGHTGVARLHDTHAQFWNASKYVFSNTAGGVSMGYTPWLKGFSKKIYLATLTGYQRVGKNDVISASFRCFSFGDIYMKDASGSLQGSYSPKEYALDLGYSKRFTPRWSMGLVFKYIVSNFEGPKLNSISKGYAYAFDISSSYHIPIYWTRKSTINLGINITNIGNKIDYSSQHEGYYLPTKILLGTELHTPLAQKHELSISLDLGKLLVPGIKSDYTSDNVIGAMIASLSDNPEGFKGELKDMTLGVGLEYSFHDFLQTRLGFAYEDREKGVKHFFAFGFGVKRKNVVFDVAQTIPLLSDTSIKGMFSFTMSYLW